MRQAYRAFYGAALWAILGGCGHALAQSWMHSDAPALWWRSLSGSPDGSTMLANSLSMNGGYIYYSTNGGTNWVAAAVPVDNWSSVAASLNGSRCMATVEGGTIQLSTNYGATWVAMNSPWDYWVSIACSSDGTKCAAASGHIYVSSDSGTNWAAAQGPAAEWRSVACSADGTEMIAAAEFGPVFVSRNSGTTWNQLFALPNNGAWLSVACAADGTKIAAATYTQPPVFAVPSDSSIYLSTNSGFTWWKSTLSNDWRSVACSADGSKLAAGASGNIYTSTNWGVNWETNAAPVSRWTTAAYSSDGSKFVAMAAFDGIYLWQNTRPLLNISHSDDAVQLRWTIPSIALALEEATSLLPTNWNTLTNTPSVVDGEDQVSLAPASGARFYRLAVP